MAEGENLETKIKESLSQGHLPSISLAASPPSPSLQLHEQPAISQGSEIGGPKLNGLSVAAVAVRIAGLVHYLFRAQRAALKRRSDGCTMRSRQISSSLSGEGQEVGEGVAPPPRGPRAETPSVCSLVKRIVKICKLSSRFLLNEGVLDTSLCPPSPPPPPPIFHLQRW